MAHTTRNDEDYYGLFQQFRPNGDGIEQAFAGIPDSDEYVERLLEIFQATDNETCATDAYFIVRFPLATSTDELHRLGREMIGGFRSLADRIGNAELSQYLGSVTGPEIVDPSRMNRSNDDNLLVMEATGDFLNAIGDSENPIVNMSEAFYSVACDFFLKYYLMWPAYSKQIGIGCDVFRPYFELWRRGVELSFEGQVLQLGIQANLK